MHIINMMPILTRLFQQWFLLIILTSFANGTLANSLSIDTEGYIYGQLSRILRIGMRNHAINGEIRLGYESSVGSIHKSNLASNISPLLWQFCFSKDDYESIEQLVGNYIVLEYKTPKSSSLLTCSAFNELTAAYLATDSLLVETKVHGNDDVTRLDEISSGVEFGRIVNAVASKHRNRVHFLTLQIGNSGNQFRDYFTHDVELFNFAIQCLKMAAKVKLHYVERLTDTVTHQQVTRLHIWKIEVIDERITDKTYE